MKKNIYIIIAVVAIIFIAVWLVVYTDLGRTGVKKTNVIQKITGEEAVLVIDNGEGSPKTFTAEFKEGMTAFDLLKEETEKLSLALKTKKYDIGIFIEAIGDKENGQEGKYWLYYVNGKLVDISADKQKVEPGDHVEFKFEKSPY